VDTGATYRAGRGGVRITWRDGSTTSHSAGVRFRFDKEPLRIEGRLIRMRPGGVSYEAPTMEPERRSDPDMANYIYEGP
jgi:hypothetical protein